MKLRTFAIYFFLTWGLFSSCVKEDYGNCHNYYVVNLSYMGDNIKEIFDRKINKVQMYIFDRDTTFWVAKELTKDEVRERCCTLPKLYEGGYKAIFIGNPHSTIVGGLTSSDYESMLFAAEDYVDGKDVSTNDSLYFSAIDVEIAPFNKKRPITYLDVPFVSSHYDVSVQITGVPSLGNTTGRYPTVKIEGLSPFTDFTNKACGEPTDYILETRYDGVNTLTARCNIMRHLNHEYVHLKVYSPQEEELASVNFAEFIAANSKYINTSKNEVLIPIKIEFKSLDVEITVPDWVVEETLPDFN